MTLADFKAPERPAQERWPKDPRLDLLKCMVGETIKSAIETCDGILLVVSQNYGVLFPRNGCGDMTQVRVLESKEVHDYLKVQRECVDRLVGELGDNLAIAEFGD